MDSPSPMLVIPNRPRVLRGFGAFWTAEAILGIACTLYGAISGEDGPEIRDTG